MTHPNTLSPLPWYKGGLRFSCTECGKCCTGSPGYVFVTEEEMEKIAGFLNISLDKFKKSYTRQIGSRYSLLEKPAENYDCIFLDGKKCRIYELRPKQCRTFPWWKDNLSSKKAWEFAKNYCEGINDKAPLIPYEEIQKRLADKN